MKYLNFQAINPEECNAKFILYAINEGKTLRPGCHLVNSISSALADIAYIKIDPGQKSMRFIETPDDLFRLAPQFKEGFGQVLIVKQGGYQVKLSFENALKVDFVTHNKDLFSYVTDDSGIYHKSEFKVEVVKRQIVTGFIKVRAQSQEEADTLVDDQILDGVILNNEPEWNEPVYENGTFGIDW